MSRANRAIFALAAVMAAAPATAQTVTVYGRLYPEVVWTRMTASTHTGAEISTPAPPPSGETFDNIVRMDSSNSRLGFRGEEPLGAGLKAFFQIEQRIQVDTGGTQLASRDTYVGLASDRFGTVKMGGFDTVYKEIGDTLSFLGVSSGNFVSNSSVLSKQGFGESSAGSFHLRR